MTQQERARFLNALRVFLGKDPLPTQENYAYEHQVAWTALQKAVAADDGNRRRSSRRRTDQ